MLATKCLAALRVRQGYGYLPVQQDVKIAMINLSKLLCNYHN